jgi:hypothetical protein
MWLVIIYLVHITAWYEGHEDNSMEQSPLERLIVCSASQEIPPPPMQPKSSLLCLQDPITNRCCEPDESNPLSLKIFPKIHFSTILSYRSEWSLSFRLPNQNFICSSHLPHACHMPCPSWFDYPTIRTSSLGSFLHPPVTLFLLGPNIIQSTQLSNNFIINCDSLGFNSV